MLLLHELIIFNQLRQHGKNYSRRDISYFLEYHPKGKQRGSGRWHVMGLTILCDAKGIDLWYRPHFS